MNRLIKATKFWPWKKKSDSYDRSRIFELYSVFLNLFEFIWLNILFFFISFHPSVNVAITYNNQNQSLPRDMQPLFRIVRGLKFNQFGYTLFPLFHYEVIHTYIASILVLYTMYSWLPGCSFWQNFKSFSAFSLALPNLKNSIRFPPFQCQFFRCKVSRGLIFFLFLQYSYKFFQFRD